MTLAKRDAPGLNRASAIPSIALSGSAAPQAPRDDRRDDACPICKSTRYTNPNLRILISPCFHLICLSCIERLHVTGPAKCATCNNKIARVQLYRVPTFSDLAVEREVWTRQRLAKIFNQREEDFDTLRSYNDHLEMIEDLTFNLVNGVDVEETEERIAKFQEEHAQDISDNTKRERAERRLRSAATEAEKETRLKERNALIEAQAKEIRERKEEKEKFLNELASSDRPAELIVAERAEALARKNAKQGQDVGAGHLVQTHMDRVTKGGDGAGYVEDPPFMADLGLFTYPTYDAVSGPFEPEEEWVGKWRADLPGKAAGWNLGYAHGRALDEAFMDLDVPAMAVLQDVEMAS